MKRTGKTVWKKMIRGLVITAAVVTLSACSMADLPFSGDKGSKAETGEQPQDNTNTAATPLADHAQPDNLNQAGYDVIYVIDNSKSVWGDQKVRNQAFKNITNLAVGSNNRIGAVYFADHVYESLALTSMKEKESCEKVLSFLDNSERSEENADTNIGNALEKAAELFNGQDPSREKILILFSDGINENQNEDEDYKRAADAKTLEVVPELEDMGIKIYCVFLEKDRTDEGYLHQVVNYFSEDNDYVEERFAKVTMDDISALSPAFADIFYKMQNNMKYIQLHKDSLDSAGRKSFYVPAVGIKRLDIYLDGNVGSKAKITAAGESENEMWSDGTASFYTFKNPVPGDWSVTVDGTVPEDFFGTICCYTNLSADIGLSLSGEDKNMRSVHARFFDENGEQVLIDSNADVSMNYVYNEDDGEGLEPVPVKMEIRDGEAASDGFTLDQYGDYLFRFNLTYTDSAEEFVNLAYEIPYNYQNSAPVVFDQSGRRFSGKSVPGGLQSYIEASELYRDPDGDAVTVTEVTQLNPTNTVEVTQSETRIYLTSQKAGDIAVKLSLEDTGGERSEVKIEGVMVDLRLVILLIAVVVIAALILLFMLLTQKGRKDKRKKRFDKAFEKVQEAEAKCDEAYNKCSIINRKQIEENKEKISGYLEELNRIIEENGIDENLQKVLGVKEYAQAGYENNLFREASKEWESVQDLSDQRREEMQAAEKEHKEEKDYDDAAIRSMDNHAKGLAEIASSLGQMIDKLKTEAEKISKAGKEIRDCSINKVMKEKIYCSVGIKKITGHPGVRGGMSNTYITGRVREGCFSLGDIELNTGTMTLKDICSPASNFYIMGYKDAETDRKGILIKGTEAISRYKDGKTVNTDELYLFSGDYAEIELDGNMRMTVTAN